MAYVGKFLGRLPAAPADPGRQIQAGPPAIRAQTAAPRPPGHPSSLASVQPGPRGAAQPIDPSFQAAAFPQLAAALQRLAHDEPPPAAPQPGEPYVPQPGPEGDVAMPGLPQGGTFPPVTDPGRPPVGGVHGPGPGQQPNPGNGYGGLYPPGTIGNNRPLTPIERFLLARTPHAV